MKYAQLAQCRSNLFSKRSIHKFPMRIVLSFPNIYRLNTLAAKFSMDQYDSKTLGQGSSNKICAKSFLNRPSIAYYYVQF